MANQVMHPAPVLPPSVKYVPMMIQAQKQQEMIRIQESISRVRESLANPKDLLLGVPTYAGEPEFISHRSSLHR